MWFVAYVLLILVVAVPWICIGMRNAFRQMNGDPRFKQMLVRNWGPQFGIRSDTPYTQVPPALMRAMEHAYDLRKLKQTAALAAFNTGMGAVNQYARNRADIAKGIQPTRSVGTYVAEASLIHGAVVGAYGLHILDKEMKNPDPEAPIDATAKDIPPILPETS